MSEFFKSVIVDYVIEDRLIQFKRPGLVTEEMFANLGKGMRKLKIFDRNFTPIEINDQPADIASKKLHLISNRQQCNDVNVYTDIRAITRISTNTELDTRK